MPRKQGNKKSSQPSKITVTVKTILGCSPQNHYWGYIVEYEGEYQERWWPIYFRIGASVEDDISLWRN